jgi:hypothetical protein
MIWSICEATGWTYQYVMDGVSWINIKMMLADAPRYVSGNRKKKDEDFLDDFCAE